MRLFAALLPIAALLPLPQLAAQNAHAELLQVGVDSSTRVVALTAGPFRIAASTGDGHAHHSHGREYPVLRFDWPIEGWLRGFRLRVTDAEGQPLDRRLIHHLNVVNFDRRQLFYPAIERTVAIGQETPDMVFPATVGLPLNRGMRLGLIVAWHNPSGAPIEGVRVELDLVWAPSNQMPRPVDVLFGYADVIYPVGTAANFDLPPGQSRFESEFTMPLSGRILAAGGHMHDYGTGLQWVRVAPSHEPVLHLGTRRDADGRLLEVGRVLPGVGGRGILLRRGERYRLVGGYDNPTGQVIPDGAMIHLALMFAPEHLGDWPPLDESDPETQKDLAYLATRGADRDTDAHGDHGEGEDTSLDGSQHQGHEGH